MSEEIQKEKSKPFALKVKLLEERVEALEKKFESFTVPTVAPRVLPTENLIPDPKYEIVYPVPMEYKEIINTVLNGQFGIKVEPMSDRPAFQLTIVVPEKYSNMSEDERKMYKVDLRTKIISYAEGLNGVRQYAELVANNLGPERRAQIITDRAQLQ